MHLLESALSQYPVLSTVEGASGSRGGTQPTKASLEPGPRLVCNFSSFPCILTLEKYYVVDSRAASKSLFSRYKEGCWGH